MIQIARNWSIALLLIVAYGDCFASTELAGARYEGCLEGVIALADDGVTPDEKRISGARKHCEYQKDALASAITFDVTGKRKLQRGDIESRVVIDQVNSVIAEGIETAEAGVASFLLVARIVEESSARVNQQLGEEHLEDQATISSASKFRIDRHRVLAWVENSVGGKIYLASDTSNACGKNERMAWGDMPYPIGDEPQLVDYGCWALSARKDAATVTWLTSDARLEIPMTALTFVQPKADLLRAVGPVGDIR